MKVLYAKSKSPLKISKHGSIDIALSLQCICRENHYVAIRLLNLCALLLVTKSNSILCLHIYFGLIVLFTMTSKTNESCRNGQINWN